MPFPRAMLERLFTRPGDRQVRTCALLKQAAQAHYQLLCRAAAEYRRPLPTPLAQLLDFLHGPVSGGEKRRLLCHPLFLEDLHRLALTSPELRRWHDAVTAHMPIGEEPLSDDESSILGNLAMPLALRHDPHWCGSMTLKTDLFGRLAFPFSDWTLSLTAADGMPLSAQVVHLELTRTRAMWRMGSATGPPFLQMPRDAGFRLMAAPHALLEHAQLTFLDPNVKVRLQFACRLCGSRIRYDPIGFDRSNGHAGITGGIIARVLDAIHTHSPGVYVELCSFIHAIRGFELPRSSLGLIESFSDPAHPEVMGINITYTAADEPCLSPFCFTWFGHELGHTKDYLIDNVLYVVNEPLVINPEARTAVLPRYQRSLSIRTLFQVPYVHLYEWALLMDFIEARFAGLPWRVEEDAIAFGDDLELEIEESFAWITQAADLTPLGQLALARFLKLYREACARWQRLRCHALR